MAQKEPRAVDLSEDGGGQRTEVGHPYDGEGAVRRGYRDIEHRDRRFRRLKELFGGDAGVIGSRRGKK